jgi:hypothetical protein
MRQGSEDAMRLVRGEMSRRLDAIEATLARRGSLGVRADVDALCALASEYGLTPALRLAEGLSVALGAGGRGAAIGPWIERLRDAIDCRAADPRASDTWLASIMVRFAG